MPDLFLDSETFCDIPIKHGTYRYAERAEVMLITWAIDDEPVQVWDLTAGEPLPLRLADAISDPETLVWTQNGDKFDWPVFTQALPWLAAAVPQARRRDTMIQAYSHSLPGNLELMADALGIEQDKRKLKTGRALIRLFCMPQSDGSRATRLTHPEKWEEFKEYAKQDITAMREAHRRMPMWNYRGKQLDLWYLDQRINNRGLYMDIELAEAAVRASEKEKRKLAKRTQEMTGSAVASATQRDEMLRYILDAYGVDLPDMQADTLERRIKDPDLPDELRELLRVRLESVTTSVAKYGTLLRGVNSDHRLRGTMQFRGAGRTGRVAHRLFQSGNMPRPDMKADEIAFAIELLKLDAAHLVFPNVMRVCSNAIRGTIIAPPGKKLAAADLSNIEGRMAAWLAGEDWKLRAFEAFDAGEGHDLYIVAYSKSFNVPPESVPLDGTERQIGKVEELMFQYGGGVGAWITGAATYGIDLGKMTDQVWETLPDWAKGEAADFLEWLCEAAEEQYRKELEKVNEQVQGGEIPSEEANDRLDKAVTKREARKLKARLGLPERTFIACDAIKRLWRRAHPEISSYWKQIENTVTQAIQTPGEQFACRRLKIRRDGAWLRIGLPSGRVLCYPHPRVDAKGHPGISYMGLHQYTRKWQRIGTYGGKLFENVTQAAACDQLLETGEAIEAAGFEIVLSEHDAYLTEAPADRDDLSAARLGELMCADLGWNRGLPLAAKGFEALRNRKG